MPSGTRIRWVSQLQDTQLPGELKHEKQFGGISPLLENTTNPEQRDLGPRRLELMMSLQAAQNK